LVVGADGDAVLVVDGLGPAPEGKTYQMWIVPHGGEAESAGTFPGADEREVLPVDGTVDAGEIVAVTIERAGGADAPTTKPIVGTMPV
jgi:anti-sigma-K factor RskA